MNTPRLPQWKSLRVRLPLLVSGSVAVVLAVFLWTTHQALEQSMVSAGAERATVAAAQVTELLAQSTSRGLGEARRIATDPALRAFLLSGEGDAAGIRKLVASLAAPSQPPVEVWDAQGNLLLAVGPEANPSAVIKAAPSRYPADNGLSPFHLHNNAVAYELVTDVYASPEASTPEERIGVIVMRRTLTGAQNATAVRRLVGEGASVLLGNQANDVWTDLAAVAAPPGVDTSRDGLAHYRDAEGTDWIGAVKLIPSTPWAVWVGFPRDVVLEPADSIFRRMVLLATVLVLVAGVGIWVLSDRLTRPLRELTSASEAIAAGDFDRRVQADRTDEIGRLGAAFNAMITHVSDAHHTLEARVRERTEGLQRVNQELEAFSYSVSHDLRAPLRHVVGFSSLLQESGAALGEKERRYIATIVAAANRMGKLIDDLLAFSRVGRTALNIGAVDLNQIVREAQREVGEHSAARDAVWTIDTLPTVQGDRALLRLVLVNLLSNAVKYSATRTPPQIHVGATHGPGEVTVFVRDNGVGFDMEYVHKLFGVFQRLHRQEDFEGTGIGLANVRRIVERHGGRAWAEAAVDQGATFYFSLPDHGADVGGMRGS